MSKVIEKLHSGKIKTLLLYPRLRKPQTDERFGKIYWTVKGTVDNDFIKLLEKHKVKSKVRQTGEHKLTFEFKANAAPIKKKDGTLLERQAPLVVDAKNNPIDDAVINNIGNGTTANLAFEILKHTLTGTAYIQLKGVQILELVEFSKAGALFSEEDGFIAEIDNDLDKDDSDDDLFSKI